MYVCNHCYCNVDPLVLHHCAATLRLIDFSQSPVDLMKTAPPQTVSN